MQGLAALAGSALLPFGAFPAAASGDTDLAAVSRRLTGRDDLNPAYLAALDNAFRGIDAGFADRLAGLRAVLDTADDAALRARLADAEDEAAALARDILTGWYLGVAGSGDDAVCVAYADALSHAVVADVLRPRSYAYGAYGSWSAKPL